MEVQQHQEMEIVGCETVESRMLVCTNNGQEKKAITVEVEGAVKCPRCESTNTKFCYYNNYSLTQPRYFCKSCRRYWTKGGTLRNVPVGGGCRKNNKRLLTPSKRSPPSPPPHPTQDQATFSDISLAIARLQQKQNIGIFDNNPTNNYLQYLDGNLSLNSNGLFGGFLENTNVTTNYHQNMFYGNMGGYLEMGSSSSGLLYDQDMDGGISTIETTTTVTPPAVKQEMWNWQFGEDGNNIAEPEKQQNWNNGGFGSSSWHALLNSPLM